MSAHCTLDLVSIASLGIVAFLFFSGYCNAPHTQVLTLVLDSLIGTRQHVLVP